MSMSDFSEEINKLKKLENNSFNKIEKFKDHEIEKTSILKTNLDNKVDKCEKALKDLSNIYIHDTCDGNTNSSKFTSQFNMSSYDAMEDEWDKKLQVALQNLEIVRAPEESVLAKNHFIESVNSCSDMASNMMFSKAKLVGIEENNKLRSNNIVDCNITDQELDAQILKLKSEIAENNKKLIVDKSMLRMLPEMTETLKNEEEITGHLTEILDEYSSMMARSLWRKCALTKEMDNHNKIEQDLEMMKETYNRLQNVNSQAEKMGSKLDHVSEKGIGPAEARFWPQKEYEGSDMPQFHNERTLRCFMEEQACQSSENRKEICGAVKEAVFQQQSIQFKLDSILQRYEGRVEDEDENVKSLLLKDDEDINNFKSFENQFSELKNEIKEVAKVIEKLNSETKAL